MSIWGHLFTRAINTIWDWAEATWHDTQAAACRPRKKTTRGRPATSRTRPRAR